MWLEDAAVHDLGRDLLGVMLVRPPCPFTPSLSPSDKSSSGYNKNAVTHPNSEGIAPQAPHETKRRLVVQRVWRGQRLGPAGIGGKGHAPLHLLASYETR